MPMVMVDATVEKEAEIAGFVTVVDTAAPRDVVAEDQGQKQDFPAAIRNFDGEIIGSANLLGVIFDTPVRQDIIHEMDLATGSSRLLVKVRRLALMIALSARVAEGRFVLVDRVDNAEGKTTPFRKKLIKLLGVEDEPNAMIIEDTESETMERTSFATNNLPKVQVAAVNKISVYELLRHRHVIMTT
eukprot:gene5255-6389_t